MSELPDMTGRVCVVTGASAGIGTETALGLARAGATVAMVGRSPAKIQSAVDRVIGESERDDVMLLLGDFSVMSDVRRVAAEILDVHPRVHVLVNNAGTATRERRITGDGMEETFAVNHAAPFLLTHLLRDALVRAAEASVAPSRVVTVSSLAHRAGRLALTDLSYERGWSSFQAYADTKLANVLFTRELARRWAGTGVTSYAVHPGAVRTGLFRENRLLGAIYPFVPFMKSPKQGAQTTLWCATAPELLPETGSYYSGRRRASVAAQGQDDTAAELLWDETARLVGMPA
ncbi:MAG TPA: SDR family oxidoreductase [Mycobacteriales bacterium]|nr:SDR family oxidoreductase [Mycobacteriales bacterium]